MLQTIMLKATKSETTIQSLRISSLRFIFWDGPGGTCTRYTTCQGQGFNSIKLRARGPSTAKVYQKEKITKKTLSSRALFVTSSLLTRISMDHSTLV